MKSMRLNLRGSGPFFYDIYIGSDILENMGQILKDLGISRRYALITDANVSALYGDVIAGNLKKAGLPAVMVEFPAGEASKNIDTALAIVRRLLKEGIDRESALIALGGGVTGDMAGFVASLYMRSIPYIQAPTTLLAQVDSSIGGKTAVDLEEGKNLLGSFYQPSAVLTDPGFLASLPEAEFAGGLAEVVKYGVIDRGPLFQLLEDDMDAIRERRPDVLVRVIENSCRIKRDLVEIDEKDKGPRRFLNFGHTLGHALEAASGYGLSHGEGVSLGMIAAARLSEKICGLPHAHRERVENLIRRAELPMVIPAGIDTDLIIAKMQADKKKSGGGVNFVLVRCLGEPFVTVGVGEDILRETIEEMKR